jgi:hypothetical protein
MARQSVQQQKANRKYGFAGLGVGLATDLFGFDVVA